MGKSKGKKEKKYIYSSLFESFEALLMITTGYVSLHRPQLQRRENGEGLKRALMLLTSRVGTARVIVTRERYTTTGSLKISTLIEITVGATAPLWYAVI